MGASMGPARKSSAPGLEAGTESERQSPGQDGDNPYSHRFRLPVSEQALTEWAKILEQPPADVELNECPPQPEQS